MVAGAQIYLFSIAIKINSQATGYQWADEQGWGGDGRRVEA